MAKHTWLTCDLVEELQQAAGAGRAVDSFVAPLEFATLPGFLEYGCAKWHCKSLSALPARIFSSPLGRALQEVRSELGLRVTGRQKPPPRTITPLAQEFFVLEGSADPTTGQDWGEFLVRFRQSVKSVGFDLEKAKGIAAALGEMADNATLHANAPVGVLVGYQVIDGAAVCCVADVGDGVLKSLTTHEAYRHVKTHKDAVRLALRRGVSRYGPGQGGLGFYNVFKSLAAMSGTLRFRSGEGCVTMDGTEFEADKGEESYVLFRPGFQVTICCRAANRSRCEKPRNRATSSRFALRRLRSSIRRERIRQSPKQP
jgi:anti-sigma regulatory factor (Ser/Thr protein kinase)